MRARYSDDDGCFEKSSRERELDSAIQRLCPTPLVGGARRINAVDIKQLSADEAALIDRAVMKRRAEFASGRVLVRSLLNTDVEIHRHPSGRPVLPAGFTGSLAHDADFVVGAVGPTWAVRAIGIDVERRRDLDVGMSRIIVGAGDEVPDALVAFVAKEAVYNAWSSLGGDMLDHHDVRVVVDGSAFTAQVRNGWSVNGLLRYTADRVISLVEVAAD